MVRTEASVAASPLAHGMARGLWVEPFAVGQPCRPEATIRPDFPFISHVVAFGMGTSTTIEWTEATWNPVRGCSRISPGCTHCYAERMAHRFSGRGQPYEGLTQVARSGEPRWTGEVRTVPELLREPLRWRRPRMVFVNSMSDLLHDDVPRPFIQEVFSVMSQASWHSFQVLTKRPERGEELSAQLPWPSNVWMGVSVETAAYVGRISHLRRIPAAVRVLSLEPLLGPIPDLDLDGINWAIVGGESGPGARRMDPAWVRRVRDQCLEQRVPFFFKQWGGVRKKAAGRSLDGRTWDQWPTQLGEAAE